MTTTPVITKSLGDGRVVTVAVHIGQTGEPDATVRIDGKRQPGSFAALRRPTAVGDITITHAVGRVGLTATEAVVVQEAMRALAQLPECRAAALRAERRDLVDDYRAAVDAERDRQAAAHDRGDMLGAMRPHDGAINAAREAVRRFDAAHPGIAAKAEAERSDATDRHMWD